MKTPKILNCILVVAIGWVSAVSSTVVVSPLDAAGQYGKISPPTLIEVLDTADRIARVKIVDRKAQKISADPLSNSCGNIFRAEVVESIKGGNSTFEFFSAVDSDFKGFDKEYLVFAYRRNVQEIQKIIYSDKLAGLLTPAEEALMSCRASAEYFVPLLPQLFFTFEAENRSNESWILQPERDAIFWCEAKDGASRDFLVTEVGPNGKTLIDWNGLKRLIANTEHLHGYWDRKQRNYKLARC